MLQTPLQPIQNHFSTIWLCDGFDHPPDKRLLDISWFGKSITTIPSDSIENSRSSSGHYLPGDYRTQEEIDKAIALNNRRQVPTTLKQREGLRVQLSKCSKTRIVRNRIPMADRLEPFPAVRVGFKTSQPQRRRRGIFVEPGQKRFSQLRQERHSRLEFKL